MINLGDYQKYEDKVNVTVVRAKVFA